MDSVPEVFLVGDRLLQHVEYLGQPVVGSYHSAVSFARVVYLVYPGIRLLVSKHDYNDGVGHVDSIHYLRAFSVDRKDVSLRELMAKYVYKLGDVHCLQVYEIPCEVIARLGC